MIATWRPRVRDVLDDALSSQMSTRKAKCVLVFMGKFDTTRRASRVIAVQKPNDETIISEVKFCNGSDLQAGVLANHFGENADPCLNEAGTAGCCVGSFGQQD
jgi:hypothetical protein